jgi:hypothetical protein
MLKTIAFVAAVAASASASAAQITVVNVGSILNESIALPAESTPGAGGAFAQFFEFTLPTQETVTVSMSDSAIGAERITGGVLALNDFTSTGPAPLFIPSGALIESSPILNTLGGQEATVTPDVLAAGAYFTEISGVSGASPIKIAVDGTVTATTVPEASTWAMMLLGVGFMTMFGLRRKQSFGV